MCIRWLPRAGPSVNAALMADSPTPFRTGARGNPRLMGASRNSTTSARSSSAPAVLFDVDGTLVDSNYLHVHAWQRAFTQAGFDVEAWRTHRSIGMDGSILVRSLTGDQSGDVVDRLKHAHADFYRQTAEMLRALPGARALLDEVAALGLQVVLATSAPEDELSVLREVLGRDDILSPSRLQPMSIPLNRNPTLCKWRCNVPVSPQIARSSWETRSGTSAPRPEQA